LRTGAPYGGAEPEQGRPMKPLALTGAPCSEWGGSARPVRRAEWGGPRSPRGGGRHPGPGCGGVMALRLADPLVALSTMADLGIGLPPGEATRSCVLATALARSMDLPETEVAVVYYTALLQHLGCTGFAHET